MRRKRFYFYFTIRLIIWVILLLALLIIIHQFFLYSQTRYIKERVSITAPLHLSPEPEPLKKDYVRILSINGGGVRTLIPLHVLIYIEEKSGKRIGELFDIIVGSSSGGIIAVALSTPDKDNNYKFRAVDLLNNFEKTGKNIFTISFIHRFLTINGLIGPLFNPEKLLIEFHKLFYPLSMAELKNRVILPSYAISSRQPFLFRSRGWPLYFMRNFYIDEVLAGVSSAPAFFPPVTVKSVDKEETHTILGAILYANNPVFLGLLEALRLYPNKEVVILSLGTGNHIPSISEKQSAHWGEFQWEKDLITLSLSASSSNTSARFNELYNLHQLPILKYLFLDIPIDKESEGVFDLSKKNLIHLNNYGHQIIHENKTELDKMIKQLY